MILQLSPDVPIGKRHVKVRPDRGTRGSTVWASNLGTLGRGAATAVVLNFNCVRWYVRGAPGSDEYGD